MCWKTVHVFVEEEEKEEVAEEVVVQEEENEEDETRQQPSGLCCLLLNPSAVTAEVLGLLRCWAYRNLPTQRGLLHESTLACQNCST